MASDFRFAFIAIVAAAVVTLTSGLSPASASPETFVQTISKQVLAAARTNNTAKFRALLRQHADIRGIANFALGKYKRKVPAAQLSTYYKLAEDDMVKFFGEYSSSLTGNSVTVGRVSTSGKLILVDTKIDGTGTAVSWRLVRSGGYKVRDVQVLGIWLGHLMRSTYASILRRSGYKKLFTYLRD